MCEDIIGNAWTRLTFAERAYNASSLGGIAYLCIFYEVFRDEPRTPDV